MKKDEKMMQTGRVVLAPDSFKGTLSAEQVCAVLEQEIHAVKPNSEIISLPVADGGEGTVDAFEIALKSRKKPVERVTRQVVGPFGELVSASYLLFDEKSASFRDPKPITTAVIEMAASSGLPLARTLAKNGETNPAITTTYGVGQLIGDALANGATKIVLGLGGSATNDGGAGVMAALGVRFFDADGNAFTPVGGTLPEIARVDRKGLNPLLQNASIVCMCDVDNPLCGERGAAHIFGPQKGANPAMVKALDEGLLHFAEICERAKLAKPSLKERAGAGAAGGMGYGLSLLGAKLKSGIDTVLDLSDFDMLIKDAEWIITGEGKFDNQSLHGKVVSGIGKHAKKQGVPVLVICGMQGDDVTEEEMDACCVKAVYPCLTREEAAKRSFAEIKRDAEKNLRRAARKLVSKLQ